MTTASVWRLYRHNVPRVLILRDKIVSDVFGQYLGARPEGDDFICLVRDVADYLRLRRSVVMDSLRVLAGQRITLQLAATTAWRLAGNIRSLRKDVPAPPWSFQHAAEVVPVQVMSCTVQQTVKGRMMHVVRLRVMAGTPAPMVLFSWWSKSFCYILSRRLGYTSYRGDFPFSHPDELVNLRMLVLLDPSLTRDGRPGFKEVKGSQGLKKWNRAIIEKRFRRQGDKAWPCPNGYTHYCYQCHVGYVDCEAATQRVTTLPTANLVAVDSKQEPEVIAK